MTELEDKTGLIRRFMQMQKKVQGIEDAAKEIRTINYRQYENPELERLTAQIAHAVADGLGARGVLTVVTAQQLCMTMRDSRAHGTQTVTSEYTGAFATDHGLCQQAWSLLEGVRNDSNA